MDYISKQEFRDLFKQEYPTIARDMNDDEIDESYDHAIKALGTLDGLREPEAATPTKREGYISLAAILTFSLLLRWTTLAIGTYWLNRVRHLFGREEKFRVRDMNRLMLAGEAAVGLLTYSALNSHRISNLLREETLKAMKGIYTR